MQALPKDSWRYAFLLIVLFAIAALATQATINHIEPLVDEVERPVIIAVLCTLTFGLMLISAAFAVWAIRFSAEAESLRRLGSVVDAMTYIRDGVLSVDRQGNITGMNPTAREMLNVPANSGYSLHDIHVDLTDQNIELLLQGTQPEEVECTFDNAGHPNTLRFRSQPSKGATLVIVSDVTKLSGTRTRHRRAAYLQLVGHIAQGVANDFNNLLCGISGHASLITRSTFDTTMVRHSADAITECANRGIHLAGRLLELSVSTEGQQPSAAHPAAYVDTAIDSLATDLASTWNIVRDIDQNIPPINLTGIQIEHIVHGLGLLAADIYDKESVLSIDLGIPQETGLRHTEETFAGIITVAAAPMSSIDIPALRPQDTGVIGLIESVVASMLLQTGGRLDCFRSHSGIPVYRVCLPFAASDEMDMSSDEISLGLEAYITNWNVLMSRDLKSVDSLQRYLERCDVTVECTQGIINILSRIERGSNLSVIILSHKSLGDEYIGLLRAITKLCPQAGIVVEVDHTESNPPLSDDVVFVAESDSPTRLIRAMIDARSLARTRQPLNA